MSLITRCPACTTMFRVVADQLRLSEGWVRCGQCDEVFDANAHVQPEFEQALPNGTPESPVEMFPDRAAQSPQPPASAPEDALQELPAKATTDRFLARNPHDLSHVLQFPEPPRPVQPEPLPPEPLDEVLRPDVAKPVFDAPAYVEPKIDLVRSLDDEPPPSFVRTPTAPSVWNRPWVRAVLGFSSFLLGLLLVFQVVIQERDQIAARQPQARPLLMAACDWLQCQVRALREIESVTIDSSSFVKIKADVYRVNFTLKNTGPRAVATPAMELTLTDTQDRPVVRRVFLVRDFGADRLALDVGTELAATLSIGAKVPGDWARVSGYRLLAFYP